MTTNLRCLERDVALAGTPSTHRHAALSSARVLFHDGLRGSSVEGSASRFPRRNDEGVLFPLWAGRLEKNTAEWSPDSVHRPQENTFILTVRTHNWDYKCF